MFDQQQLAETNQVTGLNFGEAANSNDAVVFRRVEVLVDRIKVGDDAQLVDGAEKFTKAFVIITDAQKTIKDNNLPGIDFDDVRERLVALVPTIVIGMDETDVIVSLFTEEEVEPLNEEQRFLLGSATALLLESVRIGG